MPAERTLVCEPDGPLGTHGPTQGALVLLESGAAGGGEQWTSQIAH